MKVIISAIRPFDSECLVSLAALDVQTEDGDIFNVIAAADTALTLLRPMMDSGAVVEVPDWDLLPVAAVLRPRRLTRSSRQTDSPRRQRRGSCLYGV